SCLLRGQRDESISPATNSGRQTALVAPSRRDSVTVDLSLDKTGPNPSSQFAVASRPLRVSASLHVDGAAVPAMPVEFALRGPGTLSLSTTQTDDRGEAAVMYLAPPTWTGTSVLASA